LVQTFEGDTVAEPVEIVILGPFRPGFPQSLACGRGSTGHLSFA
jgi:hypothetical protein